MKTIKQIREKYNEDFLDRVELPDEIVLDEAKKDSLLGGSPIPSYKEMPMMLLFKRISYRVYPNKQVVALYYSNMVDKYLSIPFGPKGNLNLSEAVILDNLDEDWQKVNRRDRTDGLSQAAVNAYRRENPGSKLKTAVTEKNPKGKRAARRKSFCARMGGMKKRLTSAKTARDPDSRINKALRRWNCEEDFKMKLNTLREEKLDENPAAALVSGALRLAGSAGSRLASGASNLAKQALAKQAGKWALKKAFKSATGVDVPDDPATIEKAAQGAASHVTTVPTSRLRNIQKKEKSSFTKAPSDAAYQAKLKAASQKELKENKMSDLRKMVNENIESISIPINGKEITLNNSMAKRILEVYDSVNTKNKKIVEGMLNEDLESFKKLLNFSIKA